MNQCTSCKKKIDLQDQIYFDGYFGQIHCSWECLIEYMSKFFGVKEGETVKLEDYLRES